MDSFGFDAIFILAACGGFFALVLGVIAVGLVLVKVGVIGRYWLKGGTATQSDGEYTLNQSRDIS